MNNIGWHKKETAVLAKDSGTAEGMPWGFMDTLAATDPKNQNIYKKELSASTLTNYSVLGYHMETLLKEIRELSDRVGQLENAMCITAIKEVEIRNISYARAKKEIAQYFETHHGEDITPSDLEIALGIEFEMAFGICEELAREGQIK